ncbi:YiiD C-terminal domain-containing protein [Parafrankia sp. FMc2]|uniref:YiiD C-terminal domain-containing protein n=1 Tax=Parafrankia sp. FMc2 TaxID=3233196 RepID=UPI003B5893BD
MTSTSAPATPPRQAGAPPAGPGETARGAAGPFAIFDQATADTSAPDFDRIREIANAIVPFRRFVGIDITEIDAERSVVEIPDRADLTNQLGTVHAGALFLAADLAGAAAVAGALAARLSRFESLVVRDARSAFRRPARGRIRAVGLVDERETRRVRAGTGPERFDLDVRAVLYDDADVVVARFHFDYACAIAGD